MTCENNDHDWHLRIVTGDALLMCLREGCTGGPDGTAATGYDLIGDENYWDYLSGDFPVEVKVEASDFYETAPDSPWRAKIDRWISVSPRTGTTKG